MTQTQNRLLDEFAKLATDAAAVAQGMRREVETAVKAQAERFLADMDVVSREDHDTVKEMAARARTENEALRDLVKQLDARVATLEAKLGIAPKAPDVAIPGPDADA
jgi:BMFP domain-containing protein YqiC